MRKNKLFKLTSVILLICMTFSMFSVYNLSWFADETVKQSTNGSSLLSASRLPDVISQDEVIENGYIARLKEDEKGHLNRLVFQNADGKKTLRLFNHPVKYIDKNGDIRDISLEITAKTGGGFKTAANSVVTEFSPKLSGGITLTHDDVNIKMVPYNTGLTIPTASLSEDKKTVRYRIDSKTAYDYSLTYTGFKEDIVVNEYTGQTSFLFTLYTGGLTLSYEDGRYVLVDKSGAVKAEMSEIIIFTADERNNGYGSMSYRTVRAGEEYVINIQVDEEYLRDENTKYPIK